MNLFIKFLQTESLEGKNQFWVKLKISNYYLFSLFEVKKIINKQYFYLHLSVILTNYNIFK